MIFSNVYNNCIDFFVLVECIKTHQNNDKDLFFENNKHQFTENYLKKHIQQACTHLYIGYRLSVISLIVLVSRLLAFAHFVL